MTENLRLLLDFGHNPLIISALMAIVGALGMTLIGMVIGNHRNGNRTRKIALEVGGAALVGILFAKTIDATANPFLVAAIAGVVWSGFIQALRVGITRLILIRNDNFVEGVIE